MNSSVTKAINLLEELAKSKKPVALKDLARNVKLNKATAYRLLSSLSAKGVVQKTSDAGFYALGPKLLAFADEYRRSFTMRDMVVPYLEQLVQFTGETAIYCERYQRDTCVTVERWESPHQTRTVIETGIPRPLYAGSSGMAILAMLPTDEIVSILSKNSLERFTPFTVTSQKQLLKKCENIKHLGYAVSIQERYLYTAGVAAPCFRDGGVIASIAIIGPAERIEAMGFGKIGKIVKKVGDKLSVPRGYSEDSDGSDASRGLRLLR
jgi:DNA-binding IclR family transcriptional regulator